jgi:hypothetical protein
MGDGSLSNGFTGGTVSGSTNFTNGLTANTLNVTGNTLLSGLTATTISATTYLNLPVTVDTFVTGFTLSNNTITLTQNRTDLYSAFTISLSAYSTSAITATSISATTISGGTFYGNGSNLTGVVHSVGLSMPSAFTVANSPITDSGTLVVTATGTTNNFVDGTGNIQLNNNLIYCRNKTSDGNGTLYKGTIIYINGSVGTKVTITRAIATGETTSSRTFGVVYEDIIPGTDGLVLTFGDFQNIDTRTTATYPFTDVTLADGNQLYLSPIKAGYVTNVKPSAPNHMVYIGTVINAGASGEIDYRLQNGYQLEELHNVAISGVTNKDILQYNSSNQLWENKNSPIFTSLSAGTISATTYVGLPLDIRVTGATLSGGVATFTNNSGGTFTLTGFPDAFTTGYTYDNANTFLLQRNQGQAALTATINVMTGLTVSRTMLTTGSTLIVSGATNTSTGSTSGTYKALDVTLNDSSTVGSKQLRGLEVNVGSIGQLIFNTQGTTSLSTTTNQPTLIVNRIGSSGNSNIGFSETFQGVPGFIGGLRSNTGGELAVGQFTASRFLTFYGNNAEAARIAITTNNFLINTTSDTTEKLQVAGSTYISTTLKVGTYTQFTGITSVINTNGEVRAGGGYNLRAPNQSDNSFYGLKLNGATNPAINKNGVNIATFDSIGSATSGQNLLITDTGYNPTTGSGTVYGININSSMNPPSGSNTISYNFYAATPTITQGTFGTGTIRGFYYAPTINSLNTSIHRAWENTTGDVYIASNSGQVGIGTVPTTSYKLDISGTTRIGASTSGNKLNVFGTDNEDILTVNWSGTNSIGLGSNTANNPVLRLGVIRLTAHPSGARLIMTGCNTFGNLGNSATMGIEGNVVGTSVGTIVRLTSTALQGANRHNPTSGTLNMVTIGDATTNQYIDFSPASGSATFNSLYIRQQLNTSGTYSGIVRGVFYDPILTSTTGINHRAWENTTGDMLFGTTTGSTGIGANTSINASAILDVTSTTKGMLPPRMTTVQMTGITSPAIGLELYNTVAKMQLQYDGTAYKSSGIISGSISSGLTASTTITVIFGGTQPNITYKVSVTPTSALALGGYVTNKTTTTFDFILPITTGVVTFDYQLVQ